MCYDAKFLTKKVEKYAERYGIAKDKIDPLIIKIGKTYHANGFQHPLLPVITGDDLNNLQAFSWGLVPPWVKSWQDVLKIRRKTLNARSETVFELPSFRASAKSKRCIVVLDAFYEHHHLGKSTFPYHIELKNGDPISMAGIYSVYRGLDHKGQAVEWPSVSILTTKANEIMKEIHNNPKSKGPRMPVILPAKLQNEWIKPRGEDELTLLVDLLKPFPSDLLQVKTVQPLRGKKALGNVKDVESEFRYPVIGLPEY